MKTKFHIISFALICAIIALTITTSAQQKSVTETGAQKFSLRENNPGVPSFLPLKFKGTKAACDTLNLNAYRTTWTVVEYSVTATPQYSDGFVNGVNMYEDLGKANYFPNSGANKYLLGGLFAFSRAWSSNPSKTVTFKVWSVSGGSPGAVLAQQTVSMQQLMNDASGKYFTYIDFATPVLLNGAPFFFGFEMANLNWGTSHDTLSLQSNQDPQTSPAAAWEKQSDGVWYQYTSASSWPLSISLAAFPVMADVLADASFTQSATNTCSGYSVNFDASASVQSAVYWDLPGATPSSSNSVAPTVSYASPGTYPVKLYVLGGSCDNIDSMISGITVIQSPVPNASASPSSVCPGVSTTLDASDGATYQWTGFPQSSQSSQIVTPTGNTTYTVTVTGSNGCTASQSVSVTALSPPVPNATATPASVCPGGSSTLNAANGISYQWTGYAPGSQSSQIVTPTGNTTYTVTVTGSNGCSASQSVSVSVYTPQPVSVTANPDTICEGSSSLLTATPGMNSYSWSSALGSTAAVNAFPTSTTTFTVSVTDANGCSNSASIPVSVYPAINLSVSAASESFCGASDGTVTVVASGGTPPFTYTWNPAVGTTDVISNLPSGVYSVTVSDIICNATAVDTVDCPNEIKDFSTNSGVSVMPNPSDGYFELSINGYGGNEAIIDVFNITGQKVYNQKLNIDDNNFSKSINMEFYPKGVYYIRLITGNNTDTMKFIIE